MDANETKHFFRAGDTGLGQVLESIEDRGALLQSDQCQFAQNKRMRQHLSALEQTGQFTADALQMLYPHRGVHQNHADSALRRTAGNRLERRLGTAQQGQPACVLAFDQDFQGFAHQGVFFF